MTVTAKTTLNQVHSGRMDWERLSLSYDQTTNSSWPSFWGERQGRKRDRAELRFSAWAFFRRKSRTLGPGEKRAFGLYYQYEGKTLQIPLEIGVFGVVAGVSRLGS